MKAPKWYVYHPSRTSGCSRVCIGRLTLWLSMDPDSWFFAKNRRVINFGPFDWVRT